MRLRARFWDQDGREVVYRGERPTRRRPLWPWERRRDAYEAMERLKDSLRLKTWNDALWGAEMGAAWKAGFERVTVDLGSAFVRWFGDEPPDR